MEKYLLFFPRAQMCLHFFTALNAFRESALLS